MTSEELERAIARLFEGQDMLTGKVAELADSVGENTRQIAKLTKRAKRDRRELRQMQANIESMQVEVRDGIAAMIGMAEAMTTHAQQLTRAQQGNSQRIARVERRIDAAGLPPDTAA